MKSFLLFFFAIISCNAIAADSFTASIKVSGVLVGSVCAVSVINASGIEGPISLGKTSKSASRGVSTPFSVQLFEPGSISAGCSALEVGSNQVELAFGDATSAQLDKLGVVTKGAGEVRVEVRATDEQASSTHVITSDNRTIRYPREFAKKGIFNFKANASNLHQSKAGAYSGTVSLIISYK